MRKTILSVLILTLVLSSSTLALAQDIRYPFTLKDLTDVQTNMAPTNGQGITWNSTTGKWVSADLLAGALTPDLTFDCLVDDSGGKDYTDIDDAWTAGCRKMFVYNGSYSIGTQLTETTWNTAVTIVGESMHGVIIDLTGPAQAIALSDGGKATWSVTTECVDYTPGLTLLDGDDSCSPATTFATWGVTTDYYYCYDNNPYQKRCLALSAVGEDTITTRDIIPWYDSGVSGVGGASADYFYRPWSNNIILRNFTITASAGSPELLRFNDTYAIGLVATDIRVSGNADLFYDGHQHQSYVDRILVDGDLTKASYVGAGTNYWGSYVPGIEPYHGVFFLGNILPKFNKANFNKEYGTSFVGNMMEYYATGIDFSTGAMVAVGNMKSLEDSTYPYNFVEQLAGSLNLHGGTLMLEEEDTITRDATTDEIDVTGHVTVTNGAVTKALTDGVATGIFTVTQGTNEIVSLIIDYSIYATDATDYQVHTGTAIISSVDDAGTAVSTVTNSQHNTAVTVGGGTLTDAWTVTDGAGTLTINVAATSSLTTTSVTIKYNVQSISGQAITRL